MGAGRIREQRLGWGQGGFTLIEMLVVIAVLAVLGGVVVFAVGGLDTTARENACEVEARTILTAWSANVTEGGNPVSVPDLVVAGYLVDQDTLGTYTFTGPNGAPVQATPCPG